MESSILDTEGVDAGDQAEQEMLDLKMNIAIIAPTKKEAEELKSKFFDIKFNNIILIYVGVAPDKNV